MVAGRPPRFDGVYVRFQGAQIPNEDVAQFRLRGVQRGCNHSRTLDLHSESGIGLDQRFNVLDRPAFYAGTTKTRLRSQQCVEPWSSLPLKYVHDGLVDYQGLKRQGVAELNNYLATLSSVCTADERAATRDERRAFWINAYNAYTVKLILDHYPVRSIRSIGWLPQAAFKKKFIPMPGLGNGNLSLDEIENDILRKQLGEPRIHFAIVCASKSCPKLRSQAYRADALSLQLDQAARDFIQDSSKNRYDAARRTFYASSIFKWFRGDFERAKGSLAAFIGQ